jgi:hypothetical protein
MAISIIEPVCFNCRHLGQWPKCKAFPQGIPQSIKDKGNDHTRAVQGDNGYRFSPIVLAPKQEVPPKQE